MSNKSKETNKNLKQLHEKGKGMKEFNKVIGYDDVKIELQRIIDTMKNPLKYEKLGVHTTQGLLLHGRPGVGKTLIANCFIKASKRNCYTIRKNLPDGEFVKHITSVFAKAYENAPSIVFLDDMDKVSNNDENHKNSEEFATIQSCIDECKDSEVFVIATTNDLHAIPESLLREGRFDKQINISDPDFEDAVKIVKHYLKNKKCSKDVVAYDVAKLLNGKSCAALEAVINEAGIYAGYENREEISMDDITRSFMRVMYKAPESLHIRSTKYLLETAYHEAGHAVVSEVLEENSVNFVTVKPHKGFVGGFTNIANNDDYFYDIQFMENRVIALLAGKAATEIVYGKQDVGTSEDLDRAFRIVTRFYETYCVDGFESFNGHDFYIDSDQMKAAKEVKIANQMEKYYQQAKKILIENRTFLDAVAKELADKEVLTSTNIKAIRNSIS